MKDVYFCTPKIDHEAVKAQREKELAEETEKLKKEYEERQRRKKEKESKEEGKDKGKEEEGAKGKKEDESKRKGEKEVRLQTPQHPQTLTPDKDEAVAVPQEEEPRVFELKRFGPTAPSPEGDTANPDQHFLQATAAEKTPIRGCKERSRASVAAQLLPVRAYRPASQMSITGRDDGFPRETPRKSRCWPVSPGARQVVARRARSLSNAAELAFCSLHRVASAA